MKGTHDFIPVEAMQCSGAKDIRMEHLAKVQIPFSAVSDLGQVTFSLCALVFLFMRWGTIIFPG